MLAERPLRMKRIMAAQGRNQGFHVLDEFICEALPVPSVPLADPATQGMNGGMSAIEELVFEAGGEPTVLRTKHDLETSMSTTEPHRTLEELARLGSEVFDRQVRPALRPEDKGKFVAIDVGTGD